MKKKKLTIIISITAAVLLFSFALACNGGNEKKEETIEEMPVTDEDVTTKEEPIESESATEDYTVEYQMACIDKGEYLDEDDTVINDYSILLDSLMEKTTNSRIDISDITVTTQRLLKENGVDMSLLNILKDLDNSIPEESPKLELEDIAAAYIVLVTN